MRFAATVGRERVTPIQAGRLGNTFEAVLGRRRHDFETLRARLRAAGLLEPRLTGSGSAVFGIVPRGQSAREIAARFTGREPLYAVRSCGRGVRFLAQP